MTGPLTVGRIVERYRVEELLGEGGTAAVYRVRHTHLGTDHALKVLTLASAQAGPRLLLEGRLQAALRHPNIVAVTDVLEIDSGFGLLMEYVPPPTLAGWIVANPPRVHVAEALFRGILEGVRHAHQHGLVHRDLKPANVLLARVDAATAAGGLVPKVADFGLARLLDADGHRHTRSGFAMGTPQYMAPEQFRDAKGVDRRADLFSLGCILHELLSGAPAFAWTDLIRVYSAMSAGDWAPLPADVPARLRAAVAGCLEPDADARIPDCGTLLSMLDGAERPRGPTLVPGAEQARVAAGPVAPAHPVAPPPAEAATIELPVPGAAAAAATFVTSPRAPDEPETAGRTIVAPVPPERRRGPLALGLGVAGAVVVVALVALASWPDAAPRAEGLPIEPPTVAEPPLAAAAVPPGAVGASPSASDAALPHTAPRTSARPPRAPITARPSEAVLPTREAPAPSAPPPTPTATTSEPAPASDARASVRASGASTVWLAGSGGRFPLPARVAPGRYQVWADFGAGAVAANEVALAAGDDVELRCNDGFQSCPVHR